MSKITVTTIAGQSSGSDANKVKIESGDTLEVVTNATVGGTLGVTGDLTVDGNTLHVDASNNKVGLGVDPGTMPSFITHAALVPNGGGIGITSPAAGNNRYIYFGTGTSSSDVQLAAIQNTSSDLIFKGASGAEKARILNSGGITFNGDTAAANALDDYEEGSWTANLIGSSSNPSSAVTVTGQYTKIGQLVYVNAQFSNFNNSGASGGVRVNGLPFTPSPGNQASGNVMIQTAGTWGGTNTAGISPYFGATYVGFYGSQQGSAWFEITHNTTAAGYLSFSGTYKV